MEFLFSVKEYLEEVNIFYVQHCDKPHYNEGAKGFMFSLNMSKRQSHNELIYEIEKMKGVLFIEQI